MGELHETAISCPYCGEGITILVDDSVDQQQYIEDCEVCCRPMVIAVNVSGDGSLLVSVQAEDE